MVRVGRWLVAVVVALAVFALSWWFFVDIANWSTGNALGVAGVGLTIAFAAFGRWSTLVPERESPVPQHAELLSAAHRQEPSELAPIRLQGRDQELSELTVSAQEDGYVWWQAEPWAGKTALMARFASKTPRDVRIVSFFVNSRLTDQSDSRSFTSSLIRQLAALAGIAVGPEVSSEARVGQISYLLSEAAHKQHVVLLVDGLDEDRGGFPSIAYFLPRRPPPGVRVIVSSRPRPGVPSDVPGDHPLRNCPVRMLAPSPYAAGIKHEAEHELRSLFVRGDNRDLLGLLTASGGGLSTQSLAALTDRTTAELSEYLAGAISRSLQSEIRAEERVWLFAHDTLRVTAEAKLSDELPAYRELIHRWAQQYRRNLWPNATPDYLFAPYAKLLVDNGDLPRLARLAIDEERHEQMLRRTGGDAAALDEIVAMQELALTSRQPDLKVLAVAACERFRLATRNRAVPAEFATLWAQLGHVDRAVALARSVAGTDRQASSLARIAIVIEDHWPDRANELAGCAESLAHSVTEPHQQAGAFLLVARAVVRNDPARAIDLTDQALRVAKSAAAPRRYADVLTRVAEMLVEHDLDSAERFARAHVDPRRLTEALTIVASRAAHEVPERAERIAESIADPSDQAEALVGLATCAALHDSERAARLTDRAERAANAVSIPGMRARALATVAKALTLRSPERAEALTHAIADPYRQADVLTQLAASISTEDNHRLVDLAMRTVDAYPVNLHGRDKALVRIAAAAAYANPDRAEEITQTIVRPANKLKAIAHIVTIVAPTDPVRARDFVDGVEQLADTLTNPRWHARALTRVAVAIAPYAAMRAEEITRAIVRNHLHMRALRQVAGALAGSAPNHATNLAERAEQLARTASAPHRHVKAIGRLAEAVAHYDPDGAEQLAHGIADPNEQGDTLVRVGVAIVNHDSTRAERIVRTIANPQWQATALARIATVLTPSAPARAADLAECALRLIRAGPDSEGSPEVLALAAEATAVHNPSRATKLAEDAEALVQTAPNPRDRALGLSMTAKAMAVQRPERMTELVEQAIQLAETIADPLWRTDTLTAVAESICTVVTARAEQLAVTITEPGKQARVLGKLASTAAASGATTAQRTVARLLTSEAWYEALPALAKLEPSAVRAVSHALPAPSRATQQMSRPEVI